MKTMITVSAVRGGMLIMVPRVAWMGGSSARAWIEVPYLERQLVKAFFIEQREMWERHWGERLPRDVRNIFWSRARGDAHATTRDLNRSMKT